MNRLAGWSVRLFAFFLFLSLISLGAAALPAAVMTNTGAVMEGSILGLGPTIRLAEPGGPLIGPAGEFDVPLSVIKQITIDFPRLIIETEEGALIGPFSAFTGIDQQLKVKGTGGDLLIPTTSIRAIALNGNPLHPVPREWLGDRFLTGPKVIQITTGEEGGCAACTISAPERTDETPIWNTIHPVLPPPETGSELPWWLGLIGVAALIGLIYFLSTSSG